MSQKTPIAWTDSTWSPVLGCSPVSAGCGNCYARRDVWRMAHNPNPKIALPRQGLVEKTQAGLLRWTGKVALLPEQLAVPLHWRTPRRIFLGNQSDLFHENVPEGFIDDVFAVMACAFWHRFQVLTKRPKRMRRYFADLRRRASAIYAAIKRADPEYGEGTRGAMVPELPLRNVDLGVSVEDQPAADERIPELLATPAALRYLSCEPLLGPLDLYRAVFGEKYAWHGAHPEIPGMNTLGFVDGLGYGIDWVIVGGESGPEARPCAEEWIRSLVVQCKAASTPVFVKQLGDYAVSEERTAPASTMAHRERLRRTDYAPNGEVWAWRAGYRHRAGGDPAEWPEDLRVRQLPSNMQVGSSPAEGGDV